MIDNKKIEEAAKVYMIGELYDKDKAEWDYPITNEEIRNQSIRDFKEGAKWAINEFLKDLLHPASEVPRNDNGKVLAFSRELGFRKLYDMNAMLDETTCNTYQQMWKKEVKAFRWSDWVFIEEFIDLLKKGGNHD